MSVTINDTGLKFAWALTKRSKTTHLIIHHVAGENQTVEQIHNYHKNANGWAGIAYNFYIRKDGTVYKGRGWEYVGGHATNYNSISIGICFEGNYDSTSTSMPDAQYNAGVALIAEALERYPTITTICGHKTVGSTACPGKYFPLDKMIADGKAGNISNPVVQALNTLQKAGVINTPDYWVANYNKLQYLDQLIINFSKLTYKSKVGTGITTPQAAINELVLVGAINTAEYWLNNYSKVQYLGEFLMNVANRL